MAEATDSYYTLELSNVVVYPILTDSIDQLLKKTKRQLTTRKKIRNNRHIASSIEIHKLVFLKYYKAIRDYKSEFGRSILLQKGSGRRRKEIKKIVIIFTHKGSLTLHLKKASTLKVSDFFQKKVGNSNIELVVNNEQPAKLSYDMNKNRLDFSAAYKVTNKYGNIC